MHQFRPSFRVCSWCACAHETDGQSLHSPRCIFIQHHNTRSGLPAPRHLAGRVGAHPGGAMHDPRYGLRRTLLPKLFGNSQTWARRLTIKRIMAA